MKRPPRARWSASAAPLLVAAALFVPAALAAQPPLTPPAPVVPASGPGFTTIAAFTLPPTFYVGDRVELRVRLRANPGTLLRAPAKMPADRWIRIDSISISHTSDYSVVHLFFVSFAPGERTLPPIDLGGITLAGIRITTTSLIAGTNARLTDPKGQLALPGTSLIVAVIVALLLGLPLGGLFIYRRARRLFGDLVERRRARRPWRQFARALDALGAQSAPMDARSFYIALLEALKRYLSSKFGRDFRAVTAREFSLAVRATAVSRGAADGLSAIMSFGELVKFARHAAGEETLRRDLARVREIIAGVEETSERELSSRGLAKEKP